jgi:hypothetical protein
LYGLLYFVQLLENVRGSGIADDPLQERGVVEYEITQGLNKAMTAIRPLFSLPQFTLRTSPGLLKAILESAGTLP